MKTILLKRLLFPPKLIGVFLLVTGLSCHEENSPVVKTCRIREMYFVGNTQYTFRFDYNRDGTLNKISSPNRTITYERDAQQRIKKVILVTVNDTEVLTYEYPKEGLITWTSSVLANNGSRQFYLYHSADKIDSLKVTYPEQGQQPYTIFRSQVKYVDSNVESIFNTSTCCRDYTINEIEYDDGLNPQFLLRQHTGLFTSYDIFNYVFYGFYPQNLSKNNVTRYIENNILNTGTNYSTYTSRRIFQYVYPRPGSYPSQIIEFVDGSLNGYPYYFVYENCD